MNLKDAKVVKLSVGNNNFCENCRLTTIIWGILVRKGVKIAKVGRLRFFGALGVGGCGFDSSLW